MFQLNIHHIKGESGWENPCTWSNEFSHDISFISPRFPNLSPPKIPIFPRFPNLSPNLSPIFPQEFHIIPAGLGDMPMMAIMASRPLANSWDSIVKITEGSNGGYRAIISWISPKLLGRWMDIWSAWTRGKCDLVGGAISPSWKIWVRQREGWHPIYEMENIKCLKPPTSDIEESD